MGVRESHDHSLLGSYYYWCSWACNLTLSLQDQQNLQLQKISLRAERIQRRSGYTVIPSFALITWECCFWTCSFSQPCSELLNCLQIILELSKSNEKLEVLFWHLFPRIVRTVCLFHELTVHAVHTERIAPAAATSSPSEACCTSAWRRAQQQTWHYVV